MLSANPKVSEISKSPPGNECPPERGPQGAAAPWESLVFFEIIDNQQIHKKSILRSWYNHSLISHAHGSNKIKKLIPGDGHTAELAKFQQ